MQIGFDNIVQGNAIGLAITGMAIVFFVLAFISGFIALLPIVLKRIEPFFPEVGDRHHGESTAVSPARDEGAAVVAAIGVALHRHRQQSGQEEASPSL